MLETQGLSQRRACALLRVSRSVRRYCPVPPPDTALEERIRRLAAQHPRYGYLRVWALLRREGHEVNRKRVHRLWRKLKLQVPRRRKKKRYACSGQVPLRAEHPNHVWTWDFIYDTTADGRLLRCLTISDEFTREGLAIRTRRRFPATRAVDVLEKLVTDHGPPLFLRSDNGPEFIAAKLTTWLAAQGIQTRYIEPGSPWQNAYGESFNGKFRDECLNMEVYYSEAEAQAVHEQYRRAFNTQRPHSSLAYSTPAEFKAQWLAQHVGALPPHPRSCSLCGPNMKEEKNNGRSPGAPPACPATCDGAQVPLQESPILRAGGGNDNGKAVKLNSGRRTYHHDWT